MSEAKSKVRAEVLQYLAAKWHIGLERATRYWKLGGIFLLYYFGQCKEEFAISILCKLVDISPVALVKLFLADGGAEIKDAQQERG